MLACKSIFTTPSIGIRKLKDCNKPSGFKDLILLNSVYANYITKKQKRQHDRLSFRK